MRPGLRFAVAILFPVLAAPLPAGLSVDTDFEGGSAGVEAIDSTARVIGIRPGGAPSREWPCWWFVRIRGLGRGETATLVLRGSARPARNNGADTGKPLSPAWSMPAAAAVLFRRSARAPVRRRPGQPRTFPRSGRRESRGTARRRPDPARHRSE